MEIRLSTNELRALTHIRNDSKLNQYRKNGWGVVVSYGTKERYVTKAVLKALNDAGLVHVATVHRSPWKGSGGVLGKDSYEVILTEFGFTQLARHEAQA